MAKIRIAVNHLCNDMIIGEDVYNRSGVVLVAQGSTVTDEVISLLSRHLIDSVAIEYQAAADEPQQAENAQPLVDEKQYQEFQEHFSVAENMLSDNLKKIVENSEDIDVPALMNVTNEILEKSRNETNLCNMLLMMKKDTESLYAHSINVSILCQILAKWSGCTPKEIENVAIAGLLHDVGILKFPEEMRKDFTFRKEMEGGVYNKHVLYSYNIVKNQNIDTEIKKAILGHHERLDKSGFPLRISEHGIGKLARILAIADIFDTYTMKENDIQPMSVFSVIKKMEEMHLHNILDTQFNMTFIAHIAHTMVQHRVLLNDGRTGQVVMINRLNVSRPLVQVGTTFVDLSKEHSLYIQELLD